MDIQKLLRLHYNTTGIPKAGKTTLPCMHSKPLYDRIILFVQGYSNVARLRYHTNWYSKDW